MQPGYAYGSQPPAQPLIPTDRTLYFDKLAAQGSPQMSSGSGSPDLRTSIPPYSPTVSELASGIRDNVVGTGRPVHELGG
jgi:hypothetical protein